MRYLIILTLDSFQGQIVYGVVGSLNAPFFFAVGNASGEVITVNDLKTDIKSQYEVSSYCWISFIVLLH